MLQEEIENQIQENGYGIGSILVCGMIAALIMIMAYKYNQKRRQKYLKCELLPENQDSNHADGNHRSITFPFVLSNEDDDSEDEELLNEIDCYQKDQKAHRIV